MKRKVFEIRLNGELRATKYSYNTARRHCATIMHEVARIGEVWEMETESRDIGTSCEITWRERTSGETVATSVRLIPHS